MAPVRYSVYIDSLAKFSHLDSPHYVHLENGVVIVQNDKIRTPSTLVERVELGQSVTVLGKPPLLGFKWKLPSGLMRKFQVCLTEKQKRIRERLMRSSSDLRARSPISC